jgi:cytidine deaminase
LSPIAIIIDLDDTLMATGELYRELRSEFLDILRQRAIDQTTALEAFEKIEAKNIELYGHLPERYSISMLETLERLGQGGIPAEDEAKIAKLGERLRTQFPALVEGAESALRALRSWGPLYLLTRGDARLQLAKVEHHSIGSLFEDIWVVERKGPSELRAALKRWALDQHSVWVVGDSIAADINPALACGLTAVLTPYPSSEYEWRQDRALPRSERFFSAASLAQVADLIRFQQEADLLHLADEAIRVSEFAFAPYSRLKVGAAARDFSGRSHLGTNVESASLGLTVDAEQVAIASGVCQGATRFKAMAVAARVDGRARRIMPCGKCRQWLVEFLEPGAPVAVVGPDGIGVWSVSDLLPAPFAGWSEQQSRGQP